MSAPDTAQHTWTREVLEALKRQELVNTAKDLGIRASGKGATNVGLIEKILQFQRSNLADAVPSPERSPELLPVPPQESRPNRHEFLVYEDRGETAISPKKLGSLSSNPSQDSASSGHLSLETNTSPRKDEGKGKATEMVKAEQLSGSFEEISSPHTIISHQPASTTATSSKKAKGQRRRRKAQIKPPHGGESSPLQHQENDSQERREVQQIVLASDSDDLSIESRVKKLETSVSRLQEENARFQEENARILKDYNELRMKHASMQRENSDLKDQVSDFNVRLVMLEALHPEGVSALWLGSLGPIDEAKAPQPDTTPQAPPQHLGGLEVASTSAHAAAGESNAPFLLPPFSPPPPLKSSHRLDDNRKRKFEELEAGPSVALNAGVLPKRLKPNSSPKGLLGDPAPLQRERRGGKADRGAFTSPTNSPSAHTPVTRPDYPFNQGSPSLQQRRPPRTLATQFPRHRVPSPARRPETQSSSTQLITPLLGEAIPGALVQVVAIPVRGDDARRTPEPTPSRAGPNHIGVSSALASEVDRGFNPPSSSTPARPGPSSHEMQTSTAISHPRTGAWPYERLPLINNATITPPVPAPPAISAAGPSAESHDSGGSQSSDGTDSDSAEDANQVPVPAPVETVTEFVRETRGMPPITGAQPLGALDPLRFTGAIQMRRSEANPPTPTTPDSSMRQAAPETPMATPTRYGTEISPSMRHLYWESHDYA